MKRIFKIFSYVIILFASADAQLTTKGDTTSINGTGIYDRERKMEFYQDESSFRISPESFLLNDKQLKENDFSTIWLRTRLALEKQNPGLSQGINLPAFLTLPLYLKYQEGKNLRIIYWILLQVKNIFAMYLGYKHIKKYGLFH